MQDEITEGNEVNSFVHKQKATSATRSQARHGDGEVNSAGSFLMSAGD